MRPEAAAGFMVGGPGAVEAMRTEQADGSALTRWERDGMLATTQRSGSCAYT